DRGGEPTPVRGLGVELPAAEPRQRVELRAAVVLGLLPLRVDPALLLELVEGGGEGALAHLKDVRRERAQAPADRPPVHGLESEDLQQEKVEGALDEVGRLAHIGFREEIRKAAARGFTLISVSEGN